MGGNSCGGTEHAALHVSDLPEADVRVAEGPDLFLNEMQSLWLGRWRGRWTGQSFVKYIAGAQ